LNPSARARAPVPRFITSAIMLEIKYAVPGRTARYGWRSRELCQMMLPFRSSMRVIKVCGAMMPLFANAP
jgi:hypothetical protein